MLPHNLSASYGFHNKHRAFLASSSSEKSQSSSAIKLNTIENIEIIRIRNSSLFLANFSPFNIIQMFFARCPYSSNNDKT